MIASKEATDSRIRKTSVLLPTQSGGSDLKGSTLSIPGMGKGNNSNEIDNYKRYSTTGATVGGSVHGYKRSHSLLAESQNAAGKSRLPRTGKIDSSHAVTGLGSQVQKQKNGYQKLKNQTNTGLCSSSDDSSSDDCTPKSTGIGSYRTPSFRTKY